MSDKTVGFVLKKKNAKEDGIKNVKNLIRHAVLGENGAKTNLINLEAEHMIGNMPEETALKCSECKKGKRECNTRKEKTKN